MRQSRRYSLFFVLVMLILASCKRDFLNPYDSQTPPDTWMPAQFSYTITGNNAINLTWSQPNELIDGFTLVKRKNGNETTIDLGKDALSYADTNVLENYESSTCTPISYSISARAGKYKSSPMILPDNPIFPQPTIANAGEDVTANANTINLDGNTILSNEIGYWTILSGDAGVVLNPDSCNSSFLGMTNQIYILEWSISHCNIVSSDQVVITFPFD
ncbi:MAG: hypothetical protein ACK5B6_02410, partial [Bacteroidia bacterium]